MQAPQTGLESDFGRSPTISDPLDAEDLRETLLGFKRRLPLVIGVTLFFGVAAGVRSSNLPTVYASTARLQLAKEAPDPTRARYEMYSSDYVATEYLNTQMRILESHSLAVDAVKANPKIARELELELGREATPEELGGMFQRGVRVEALESTYLVDVSYESTDPKRCDRYANAVAEAYREQLQTLWGEKTQIAEKKVSEQADLLYQKLTKSEQDLRDFLNQSAETPLLEEHEKLLVERIRINNNALSDIQRQRIQLNAQLESIQRVLEQGRPLESASPIATNHIVLNLRNRLSEAELDLAGLRQRFSDEWHEVRIARARRDQIKLQLQSEIEKIRERLRSERDEKVAVEQGLLERDRNLREESRVFARRSRLYESLKNEVDANRTFYEEFASRLKDLLHAAPLAVANARIIDRAKGAWRVRPSHSRNVILGLLFGFGLGAVIALIFERLSDRLRTLKDAVNALGIPVLGVVPHQREDEVELLALRESRSVYAEAFRRARVQLNAVGAFPSEGCGVLLCVSGIPREGKTLSALNLAIASAQAGRRTLLIDADMRSPRVHRILGQPLEPGLADAIEGKVEDLGERLRRTQVENLWVMGAGRCEANPGELLARDDTFHQLVWRLRRRFDRIVIDSPPVVAVSDATLMAQAADAVIQVVSARTSSRSAATQANTELSRLGAAPVGLIFNQQPQDEAGAYFYYYSRYGYGGEPKDEES